LPSDVTGVSIYNQKTGEFEFRPGPVLAQIVLADEINRATPKTQSSLLEAMEERQVTVDGSTYGMPSPFMVLATQNPIEYEGTFPLPEAQLDRFMMRIRLGYPQRDEEVTVLDRQQYAHPVEDLEQVASAEDLLLGQAEVRKMHVASELRQYIVDLISESRKHPDVYLGASPRGSLALFRAAQARARLRDREYVIPDDIKALAEPTLAHRLIVNPSARVKGTTPSSIVAEILRKVPVPGTRVVA
jgi:MoxR-like ATPase